jgi:hypothetical protein
MTRPLLALPRTVVLGITALVATATGITLFLRLRRTLQEHTVGTVEPSAQLVRIDWSSFQESAAAMAERYPTFAGGNDDEFVPVDM